MESPSFLWRAGVMLSVAFGLPEPSVGFLCYFLCCLWLVRAVFGLGDRSGTAFPFILGQFWDHFRGYFLRNSGVDFEAVLILLLIVAAFGFCSWGGCLGICFGNRVGFVGFGWGRRGREEK